jgi:nicotinamidase-related amidase
MKLVPGRTVLVVIDIQSKLWNVMHDKSLILENAQKLVKALRVLSVPIILTEQNPQGLGPTCPELMQCMPEVKALPKFCFNCCQDEVFDKELVSLNRKQVLLCGIESHICVHQTALELLSRGYEVQVVADAVGSRVQPNKEVSLVRMQREGAKLTVAEMAIFELLGRADSPLFKEILKVIK